MKIGRIAGIVIALGFVGFVSYSLLQTEPVKVLHPRLQRSPGGAFVNGAVHNSGYDDQPVTLEIRYYDRSGHQIGSDTISIDRLGDGATKEFSGPLRSLPPEATYSIYLNHGRNPYGN